jgi:hypothetical protein
VKARERRGAGLRHGRLAPSHRSPLCYRLRPARRASTFAPPSPWCRPRPGNNSYERYHRWFNLPVLLGLSLASPTVGAALGAGAGAAAAKASSGGSGGAALGALAGAPAAGYDPGAATLSNEMHAVTYAAKCLALAHREAANKMLQCGSAFLHPGAEGGGAGGGARAGSGAGGGGQATDALEAFSRVAAVVIYSR